MKACAIYARVSTENQRDNTSFDTQTELCREYAKEHGYSVLREYREQASGGSLDRPMLSEIRDMAERHEIDALIVFDPDRLSRSLAHLMLLVQEFEKINVGLLFVNTPAENTPEGKMLFGMKGLFAEFERAKTAERTRRGKYRAARDGIIPGAGRPPYGYTYSKGKLEIEPTEAFWVRQMYRWATEGMSMHGISERLFKEGAPTKMGGKWRWSVARQILGSETYKGIYWFGKTKGSGTRAKSRNRDKSEWIGIPVPAIIEPKLWDRAQEVLKGSLARNMRHAKKDYILKSLVRCARCGLMYHGIFVKNEKWYRCQGKEQVVYSRKSGQRCDSVYLRAARVEQLAFRTVVDALTDPERLLRDIAEGSEEVKRQQEWDERDLASLQAQEARLKDRRQRFLNLYAGEDITHQELREQLEKIEVEKQATMIAIAQVQERIDGRRTAQASAQALTELREMRMKQGELEATPPSEWRKLFEATRTEVIVDGTTITVRGMITERVFDLLEVETDIEREKAAQGAVLRCVVEFSSSTDMSDGILPTSAAVTSGGKLLVNNDRNTST
jgi:site-specific DNA recombinase